MAVNQFDETIPVNLILVQTPDRESHTLWLESSSLAVQMTLKEARSGGICLSDASSVKVCLGYVEVMYKQILKEFVLF